MVAYFVLNITVYGLTTYETSSARIQLPCYSPTNFLSLLRFLIKERHFTFEKFSLFLQLFALR